MHKLKQGDDVIVIAGKDKGRRGRLLSRVDEALVLVEGVNMVKKHTKPNPMRGTAGGIVDKAMPIHQSNVAIFNQATGKADRIGFAIGADGKKSRVYKSDGQPVKA